MDLVALLAGLPVAIACGAAGLLLMSVGWTGVGLTVLIASLVAMMLLVGIGMPRPKVVPRPGEESEYLPEDP